MPSKAEGMPDGPAPESPAPVVLPAISSAISAADELTAPPSTATSERTILPSDHIAASRPAESKPSSPLSRRITNANQQPVAAGGAPRQSRPVVKPSPQQWEPEVSQTIGSPSQRKVPVASRKVPQRQTPQQLRDQHRADLLFDVGVRDRVRRRRQEKKEHAAVIEAAKAEERAKAYEQRKAVKAQKRHKLEQKKVENSTLKESTLRPEMLQAAERGSSEALQGAPLTDVDAMLADYDHGFDIGAGVALDDMQLMVRTMLPKQLAARRAAGAFEEDNEDLDVTWRADIERDKETLDRSAGMCRTSPREQKRLDVEALHNLRRLSAKADQAWRQDVDPGREQEALWQVAPLRPRSPYLGSMTPREPSPARRDVGMHEEAQAWRDVELLNDLFDASAGVNRAGEELDLDIRLVNELTGHAGDNVLAVHLDADEAAVLDADVDLINQLTGYSHDDPGYADEDADVHLINKLTGYSHDDDSVCADADVHLINKLTGYSHDDDSVCLDEDVGLINQLAGFAGDDAFGAGHLDGDVRLLNHLTAYVGGGASAHLEHTLPHSPDDVLMRKLMFSGGVPRHPSWIAAEEWQPEFSGPPDQARSDKALMGRLLMAY